MLDRKIKNGAVIATILLAFTACNSLEKVEKTANRNTPENYNNPQDSTNSAAIEWKEFFTDPYLNALIDTALSHNQELNIIRQEIAVHRNEVRAKKGEILPSVNIGAGADIDHPGRYTARGASEATTDIIPGQEMPDPMTNLVIGANATWEVDIWHKLRNAKQSAIERYLSSVEGKNFMVTNLISEIANAYYELLAYDNEMDIVQQNIKIQSNALAIVKLQKQAARVTELAVQKFEAEVAHTKSLQYEIKQDIVETENRLNFLLGRFPQHIDREAGNFIDLNPDTIYSGIPSQLLANRPDIRQAEHELAAAKLDVMVARASFYPSLSINAGVGFQAFNAAYFFKTPQSLLYTMAGDLVAPLINRNALKARYYSANAKQLQAIYNYEQTILNAYVEVVNQLSKMDNLKNSFELKSQEVAALTKSIELSNSLFQSARADYMEVLMTQRDALESKFELIATKQEQMGAFVDMYQALGGGWSDQKD
jgi:NodT family efflux transporter outer membrane factor (OMF) lipoprotein